MDLQKVMAKKLGIPKNNVTFAGNKDKNAVTEQWFSIKANQRDIKKLNLKNVDILETRPFNKRLFDLAHSPIQQNTSKYGHK